LSQFLVVYRRSTGHLMEFRDLGQDRQSALKFRFAAETERRFDRDVEVVVLSADSADEVRRTHGRYFKTVPALAQELSVR
jgi:hypothetical protein